MATANFRGGSLYFTWPGNQLKLRRSITKEEVGNLLRETVNTVGEVVWPGKSYKTRETSLYSQPHSRLSSMVRWSPAQSHVRVEGSAQWLESMAAGVRWPQVQVCLWTSPFFPFWSEENNAHCVKLWWDFLGNPWDRFVAHEWCFLQKLW